VQVRTRKRKVNYSCYQSQGITFSYDILSWMH